MSQSRMKKRMIDCRERMEDVLFFNCSCGYGFGPERILDIIVKIYVKIDKAVFRKCQGSTQRFNQGLNSRRGKRRG